MSKINLLSEDLINKIAAGEVIERPASVVKELMENSLDAGATQINIEIKDSGKELIKVSDNGEGMDEEDTKNSILRHATSKIKNSDDLFAIHTLGFRGEALASIAAVSQLSITTKQKDKIEGFNIAIEGGEIISSGVIGAEQGTIIEVNNLFFNTPARKKFLKTDPIELRHIIDVVTRYTLINPTVSFKLLHEKYLLLNSPAVKDLQTNISTIYGTSLAKELMEINYVDEKITITGYIAKPYQARNDKNQQFIYINNRWVRNEDISEAVYDAYHSLLFVNKHPIFVLNLEIDAQQIDVNVHPNKSEVKIEQKKEVQEAVFKAVKETLEKNNLIPTLDLEFEQQQTFIPTNKNESNHKNTLNKQKTKYNFERSAQTIFSLNEIKEQEERITDQLDEEAYYTPEEEVYHSEQEQDNELSGNVKLPALKILGQIHKTFFVAETEGGIVFIDQHVVQERVLYERFMQQYLNNNIAVQHLLQGEIIELSAVEKAALLENQEKLQELGFNLEHFGENTFILKTIPTIFGRTQPKNLLFDVLTSLVKEKNKLEQIQEEIITRMACRASVKAGDTMTIPEIQKLLEELKQTKLPYTCPHGRSILIKLNVDELEKKFKRK